MQHLQIFINELEKHAQQTHRLKDQFEKLSDSEKELVMTAAPHSLKEPQEYYIPVYKWLENLQNNLRGGTHVQ
ncbi:hypothetical protein ACFOGI_06565 [Virgibacillus xinjiangensis]|uniref:Uncharacterized protein n=1 Tax=Virgibacillus xinjiangensis TaxID=393090 RepID=A0ABV7CU18_9BACI